MQTLRCYCFYNAGMSTSITIRNVPEYALTDAGPNEQWAGDLAT
ncbi:hypothetical protein [Wenzhouxiangella sp. EGI_FJ10409]